MATTFEAAVASSDQQWLQRLQHLSIKQHVSIFYFRTDTTCANESNTQTDTDMNKTFAIGEIADLPNKILIL